MKKLKLFFIFLLLIIFIPACGKKDDSLNLKSDEEFISNIKDLLDEPVEFIEIVDLDYNIGEKQRCYKFLLKDRNIEFNAYQAICKYEPAWYIISEQIDDEHYLMINYDDYFKQIKENNSENFEKLLEKYNLKKHNAYESIIISFDSDKLDNLYSFLFEAKELCDYKNKNNIAYRECFYVYVSLEGIDLDDNIKERENNIMYLRNFDIINLNKEVANKENFIKEINNSLLKNLEYLKNK